MDKPPSVRVLEFYSGMGGMHQSLSYACASSGHTAEVVAAFDINANANEVYEHNFKMKVNQRNIESLTAQFFSKFKADMWLMSPPCQPFSRLGNQKDSADPRGKSFLHILSILEKIDPQPQCILIENVKGFETSDTHERLTNTLTACGYTYQEFILSPDQFGIPNSRRRFFLLAKKQSFLCPEHNAKLNTFIPDCTYFTASGEPAQPVSPLTAYLQENVDLTKYALSDEIFKSHGKLMDVVTSHSNRSCCFTKGYGQRVEGTGSFICIDEAAQRYRYFTEREIANLHFLPQTYEFPTKYTPKQHYKLLGNSLNCMVVSQLLVYIFKEAPQEEQS